MKTIEKQNLIFHYLNKNYVINNYKFWTKVDPHQEQGYDIINLLSLIFDFNIEFCKDSLKYWSYLNGLEESDWEDAYCRKIKVTWSPELLQDLHNFHNIDAEAELTAMLSEQVAAEIDRDIVQQLINMYNNE